MKAVSAEAWRCFALLASITDKGAFDQATGRRDPPSRVTFAVLCQAFTVVAQHLEHAAICDDAACTLTDHAV